MIRVDTSNGDFKVRLYKNENGLPKGDCRVCYENFESTELALELLNGAEIRPGVPVHVERARFEQKGEFKPREKKKLDKIELLRLKAD